MSEKPIVLQFILQALLRMTGEPMAEPTLTLTQLQTELTELQKLEQQAEANQQQAQANVHAFQGAIAETQKLIKQLEDAALPKAPAKK